MAAQSEASTSSRNISYGQFKVELSRTLKRETCVDIATHFEYKESQIDNLQTAPSNVGQTMVTYMEQEGQISEASIAPLLKCLESLNSQGIVSKVDRMFNEVQKTQEPHVTGEPSPKRPRMGEESDGSLPTRLNDDSVKTKVFNDSVHGHIEVHPLCVKIIDTPQFQRLRFIQQLGMCYFVYPGATHKRFEHSIGVSYLAGKLARHLAKKQKELNISEEDILCVQIAGLCHDLGFGPFSQMFHTSFLPMVIPGYSERVTKLSVDMFEHMLQENNLRPVFQKYGLNETDITFIKEQIDSDYPLEQQDEWIHKGRGKEKSFLYDIVANKRNGVDVQRWDYFTRDSLYLGISNSFDWWRFLRFARVLDEPDGKQICTRDKEITSLYDMFHIGYTLDRRAYQHRVTKILEAMVAEAFAEANEHLKFRGRDGKRYKMSEAINDMVAYSKMTDNILWDIYSSTEKDLETSRRIIDRILKRDLFRCVGQTQLKETSEQERVAHDKPINPQGSSTSSSRLRVTIVESSSQLIEVPEETRRDIYNGLSSEAKEVIKETDILLQTVSFSYGKGDEDPVKKVKFYSKYDQNTSVKESEFVAEESMTRPREFADRFLRICTKQRNSQVADWVMEAFEKWCKDQGLKAKPGELGAGFSETKQPPHSTERPQAGDSVRRKVQFPE